VTAVESQKSTDTRSAILQAALEILSVDGHTALTVRRVAARAGCSTIGVYTWFGGKDGLIDAILVDGFESFAIALRSAKPTRVALGGLVAQGRAYRRWALENPMYYRVMFMQAVPGHVPNAEALTAGTISYEILRAEVLRSQERLWIEESDTDAVAMTIWGMVHGLVSIELAHADPHSTRGEDLLHQRSFDLGISLLVKSLAVKQS
jgi:AcrR family transcriptional regulator